MNLSQAEKLLAAKKKLKEYKMNKIMQEKRRNESPEQQTTQNKKPEEHEKPTPSDGVKPTKPTEESFLNHTATPSLDTTPNALNGDATNTLTVSDRPIGVQEPPEGLTKELQQTELEKPEETTVDGSILKNQESLGVRESQDSSEESSRTSRNLRMDQNIPGIRNEPKLDYFPVQKEHLLEMASAVQSALTNSDSEAIDNEANYRNQFLNSYLEEQKKIVNDLHLELNAYRSRVTELESKLATKEAEYEAQLNRELTPLKEQLQMHAQTTGILIAERTELTASLAQTQQSARKSSEEVEELTGKLKRSQLQLADQEKELTSLKSANEENRRLIQQQKQELDSLREKLHAQRTEKEELSLEASELKQKLNLKKTELLNVQQELQEKTALLSLSELRLQQMQDPDGQREEEHCAKLEVQLEETRRALRLVTEEKEQLSTQYQAHTKWKEAEEKRVAEIAGSMRQEFERRVSELERLLQEERTQREVTKESNAEEMERLRRRLTELTYERNDTESTLAKREEEAETLRAELNKLKEQDREQGSEASKLALALEGEQLAASRAVSQNKQLKEQLTDMENAFVSLSNDKLELTEQLQAERSIGRKLNAKLNNVESELEEYKEKLKSKEEELMELEKERLLNAQIADQIQHYQAQGQNAQTYQAALESSLQLIETLKKEKQELTRRVEKQKEELEERLDKEKIELAERVEKQKQELAERFEKEKQELAERVRKEREESEERLEIDSIAVRNHVTSQDGERKADGITDAMAKLQERFKRTMERVAELTEEKQELEHLVLQLQSETETIGEYITLYQKQRAVLQGRAREREQVFRELLEQRNQLQEQLHRLKLHVSDFLRKEVIGTNNEPTPALSEGVVEPLVTQETDSEPGKEKSVSELLDLLTEIKDCKDSCMFDSNFHPCRWCSGKLLTV